MQAHPEIPTRKEHAVRAKREFGRLTQMAIVFALAMGAFGVFHKIKFFSGRTFEFCHYGEIARNIVDGRGFSTRVALPGTLAVYDELGVAYRDGWPVLDRFPLYAYWVACFVRLLGAHDLSVALAAGTTYGLLAGMVFWLGSTLAHAKVGWLAAALFLLSPRLLYFTEGGYTCFAFALATVSVCAICVRMLADSEAANMRWIIAAGVVSGLAWMIRHNMVFWLPVFAAVICFSSTKRRRLLWPIVYLCAFAVTVSPAVAYNLKHFAKLWVPVTGQWNLAHFTISGADDLYWLDYRTFDPTVVFRFHLAALVEKWLRLVFDGFTRDCFSFWRMELAAAFFAVGMFLPMPRKLRLFGLTGLVMLGIQVAVFSCLRHEDTGRYYVWFAPVMLVGASYTILNLRSARSRRLASALVLAYGLAHLCNYLGPFWLRYRYHGHAYGWALDSNYGQLKALLPADALVVTNEPTQVAWYLGRATIGLPAKLDHLWEIRQAHVVRYIYVTKRIVGFREYRPFYAVVSQAGGPAGFAEDWGGELVRKFGDGGFLIRWGTGR